MSALIGSTPPWRALSPRELQRLRWRRLAEAEAEAAREMDEYLVAEAFTSVLRGLNVGQQRWQDGRQEKVARALAMYQAGTGVPAIASELRAHRLPVAEARRRPAPSLVRLSN